MLVRIDARGMSCPQPVLMCKKALGENPEGIEILVDNNTACRNVERFMKNSGYNVSIKEMEEEYLLTGVK